MATQELERTHSAAAQDVSPCTPPSPQAAKDVFSPQDQRDVLELYTKLRQMQAKLVGPDGRTEYLPNNINSFFYELLGRLRSGCSVTILQNKADLTTVEASKLLGMSRQFLIKLIQKQEIPCHMVGTHRRLYARDVLAYKAKRDANRKEGLDALARSAKEQGIYDKVPDDFNTGQ